MNRKPLTEEQKERRRETQRIRREKDRDKHNEWQRGYREKTKEKQSEYAKKYYDENRDNILEEKKEYWELNKEKIKEKKKKYKSENKDKINEWRREYNRKRKESDIVFKLSHNIRNLIRLSFKNNNHRKNAKTYDILGCSFEEFKAHLENKFQDWMNWENKGLYNGDFNYGWDIDHIIPVSSASKEEELIKLNHYTNLQPLCSKVNRDIKRDLIS